MSCNVICEKNNSKKSNNKFIRLSDIKEKKVYYVDYEPSTGNEFGRHHMSIVLKKNSEDKSLIVVPLTGRIDKLTPDKTLSVQLLGLPERLKKKQTYAVINKIRTVDYSRFENIIDKNIVEVGINDDEFLNLVSHITDEVESTLTLNQKKAIYKIKLDRAINKEIKNLAYLIKGAKNKNQDSSSIVTQILDIIYNDNIEFKSIEKYQFNQNDKSCGIDKIIKQILDENKELKI